MSETACPTSGTDMYPPIQPIAVPTSSAARPTGMPTGSLMLVKKPIRMIASTGRPIQAASQICAAGRIEMKVIEMPASVPSIAARGVILRMYGPDEGADHHDHADHERPRQAGFPGPHRVLVVRKIGSMMTKTTMNMCGTLGPYGSAVTSVRFSRRASRRARNV